MDESKTIGKDYNLWQLLKYCFPPMLTQLMLSLLQTMDDGFFIIRYVGKDALAALSIAMPLLHLMTALSSLFSGATIYCSSKMGEKKNEEAMSSFTSVAIICVSFGIIMAIIVRLNLDSILTILGTTAILRPYCEDFLSIYVLYIPLLMLAEHFSRFYMVAGKPQLSMITTTGNAILNFVGDYFLIVKLGIGIKGAAFSNLIGFAFINIFGFIFYSRQKSEVHFSKPVKDPLTLLKKVFVLSIPNAFTFFALVLNSVIINRTLLSIVDETAIACKAIVSSIQWMFMSAYFGLYSSACPMISYAYGAKDQIKLKKMIKEVFLAMLIVTGCIIVLYLIGLDPVKQLYLLNETNPAIFKMVDEGLRIAPYAFIFFGFVVFAEECFMAVHDSKSASVISIFENILFANLTALILPRLFGLTGYWFSFFAAESLTSVIALVYILKKKNQYGF